MTRRKLPENLNDMFIGIGAPIERSYGWNHAPPMPAPEAAPALYEAARRTLEDGGRRLPSTKLLASLAFQRVTKETPESLGTGLAELELAQAIMLRGSHDKAADLAPDDVKCFASALQLEMQLFLSQTAQPNNTPRGQLLHWQQVQTLSIRHTMYPGEVRTVFNAVTRELGDLGRPEFGLPLWRISDLLFLAVNLVNAKLHMWQRNNGATPPDNVDRLLSLYELNPYAFSYLVADFTESAVIKVLNAASMSIGDLASANLDHLHLDNPVWSKPIVREGERFFLFAPETIYAFHGELLATLARQTGKKARQKLGDARGRALERILEKALAILLPSAELLICAKWQAPDILDKIYETDAICLVDGVAVIFEAKGHARSAKGRRGSESWFDEIDDIVLSATEQASRLERLLREPPTSGLELDVNGSTRIIRPGEIVHVVRYGVALERMVTSSYGLAAGLRERFERAGLTPMPALTYGDINQLSQLVKPEAARIHYLLRRAELEEDFQFIADELDLIALYLRTGFAHMYKLKDKSTTIQIWGLSDFLRFYNKDSSFFDPRISIPRRTTLFWDQLLTSAQKYWPKGWVAITYDLLNIGLESQSRFERDCRRARKRWRRADLQREAEPAVMQAPGQLRPSLFLGFPSAAGGLEETSRALRAWAEQEHGGERIITVVVPGGGRHGPPRVEAYRGLDWAAPTYVKKIDGDSVDPEFLFTAELPESPVNPITNE